MADPTELDVLQEISTKLDTLLERIPAPIPAPTEQDPSKTITVSEKTLNVLSNSSVSTADNRKLLEQILDLITRRIR